MTSTADTTSAASTGAAGAVASAERAYRSLNLPVLPRSVTDLIVKIAPWLALVGGILMLLVTVPGTLLLLALSPVAAMGGGALGYVATILDLVISAVAAVMSILAFVPLRARKLGGWTLMFWSSVLYAVSGLLPLSFGGLIGALLGLAISLYLLFQIKPYYDGTITDPV